MNDLLSGIANILTDHGAVLGCICLAFLLILIGAVGNEFMWVLVALEPALLAPVIGAGLGIWANIAATLPITAGVVWIIHREQKYNTVKITDNLDELPKEKS